MINRGLVEYIASKSKVQNASLVEKDFVLHSLLCKLAKDPHFHKGYAFKGGTCLVKCYLGYYRFSEDLDFTYASQGDFEGRSEKQVRKMLSAEISRVLGIISSIAKEEHLDFKEQKDNRDYVELGGSNRFLTAKLWYESSITNLRQFIKVQINFVEKLCYPLQKRNALPMASARDAKEAKFLFGESAAALSEVPSVMAYDMQEILLEKIRAILTRKGVKPRDFVDVFLIQHELKKDAFAFEKEILLKARFMLRFEKYRENLNEKAKLSVWVKPGEEAYLLLKPLKGFDGFLSEFQPELNRMRERLLKEGKS